MFTIYVKRNTKSKVFNFINPVARTDDVFTKKLYSPQMIFNMQQGQLTWFLTKNFVNSITENLIST